MMNQHLLNLISRERPDGGFPEMPGMGFRPDATAWAGMALLGRRDANNRIERASQLLVDTQLDDGRVCLSPGLPQAFWPTPLAILTWTGADQFLEARDRAVQFLLSVTGNHWQKKNNSAVSHNTNLKGWPWIDGTHSWVEPTSLSLIALRTTGHSNHQRSKEAIEMLLDRQLPSGGWNYGNTRVFGREQPPLPEATSIALEALAWRVPPEQVQKSLNYLEEDLTKISTPFSLAWGILGLSAWGRRPQDADLLLLRSLERQDITGPHSTTNIALLLLASQAKEGFGKWIKDQYHIRRANRV